MTRAVGRSLIWIGALLWAAFVACVIWYTVSAVVTMKRPVNIKRGGILGQL